MWTEKENIFCRGVDVVKNKNLEVVIVEQLQADARCIVHHPGFEETGEGWLRLHFFSLQNITTQRFSGFSFSLFYILLFFVHVVNVNAAKSVTVFEREREHLYIYTYIYIYIFFFF